MKDILEVVGPLITQDTNGRFALCFPPLKRLLSIKDLRRIADELDARNKDEASKKISNIS